MSEIFEKEGTAAGKKHICVMKMIHVADRDADFFWNQLFDSCDDKDDLAKTVELLTSLYLQRKLKALYWVFEIMRGQGMTVRHFQISKSLCFLRSILSKDCVKDAANYGRTGDGGLFI